MAAIERMIGRQIEEMSRFSIEMDPVSETKKKHCRKPQKGKRLASEAPKTKPRKPVKTENAKQKSHQNEQSKKTSSPVQKSVAFGEAMPAFMMNEVKLS